MELAKIQPPLNQEPACCRMCQAVTGRDWFIDLGYMEDFWGRVYYCNLCFDELAVAAEYTSNTKFKEQRDLHISLENGLRESHAKLRRAADLLRDHGLDIYVFADWVVAMVPAETDSSGENDLDSGAPELVSGEDGLAESSDEQRPDDSSVLELNF